MPFPPARVRWPQGRTRIVKRRPQRTQPRENAAERSVGEKAPFSTAVARRPSTCFVLLVLRAMTHTHAQQAPKASRTLDCLSPFSPTPPCISSVCQRGVGRCRHAVWRGRHQRHRAVLPRLARAAGRPGHPQRTGRHVLHLLTTAKRHGAATGEVLGSHPRPRHAVPDFQRASSRINTPHAQVFPLHTLRGLIINVNDRTRLYRAQLDSGGTP